jgi:hypothetical protein
MTIERLAAILILTLGAGCGHKTTTPTTPTDGQSAYQVPTPDAASCVAASLDSYCRGQACPDYQTAVMAAHAVSVQRFCFRAVIGQCGRWRVVSTSDGFTGRTLYFDNGGALVAAAAHTDVVTPPCGSSRYFGFVPTCTQQVNEDLCPLGSH